MKKLIALILSLCFLLPCVAVAVSAEVGYTLTLQGEGEPTRMTGATAYMLSAPTAAPAGKVFAGWQGQLGDTAVFLPAGAEVTLTADATLTAVYVGIGMYAQPQLRYDINGLRFLTQINKADLSVLQQYTAVGFGTLIAPRNHLAKNKAMTHAAFAANGKQYLDVVTKGAYAEDDTTFWLAGSIGHVREKNFCRTLLAAGYLTVTYTDGSTGYVYAPVKSSNEGVYLYALALSAYTDRTPSPDATHVHAVAGGYSPYGATQLSYLERVLDTTANLMLNETSSGKYTASVRPDLSYYTVPFTVTFNNVMERFELTAIGDYRFDADFQSVILDGQVYVSGRERDTNITIMQEGTKLYITGTFIYTGFY